jgi:hypothetical protein
MFATTALNYRWNPDIGLLQKETAVPLVKKISRAIG